MFRFFSRKIGRCPKCFRASLSGSILGWIATAIVFALPSKPSFYWLILLLPLSFTALWIVHMLVFAGRTTFATFAMPQTVESLSRRRVLTIFLSGLLFVVLASVPVKVGASCESCGDSDCPNTPYDCHNGTCCAGGASFAYYCGQVTCNYQNPPPAYTCFDPDRLTDEQVAMLRDCCEPLLMCR
jgi:hypothetical protein